MRSPIRIAVVHYHLRRGGVTRVIETACRALRERNVAVVVLSGEPPETTPGAKDPPVRVIEALAYAADARCDDAAVRELARTATAAVREALGGTPDLWHFHNAALGRNPVVTRLVAHLAKTGVPVLSQCHDFAEDQRPENWRHLAKALGDGQHLAPDAPLYPYGPHAGLAVLNARDRDILVQAGAPAESVRLLPNPVTAALSPEAATPARDDAPPLILYPTRAIRRKNLGELLLWAAAMVAEARFATTLEPTHRHDLAVYQNWMALAERLRLPVRFGVGVSGEAAYQQHLREAAALITTSVAEGFGLAFLEPWLMGKPLTGRRLPEITADMEAEDIALSGLYDQLLVPFDWIDRRALRAALDQGLETAYATYRMPRPDDAVDAALSALSTAEQVDFGGLNETLQQQVIDHVAGSPEGAAALRPAQLAPCAPDDPLIRHNRERIQAHYAPDAYGERLHRLYLRLLEANGPIDFTPPEAVLRQFLKPERFRLLRQGTGA